MIKKIFGIFIFLFFAFSQYWGLAVAPAERMMGDVYRILYVHVPAAWTAMILLTLSFFGCLMYIARKNLKWDRFAHAAAEVGLVMTGLTLFLGATWGKPTWGVWWTWDPRLTTTAILFILYSGYLILRNLIDDPEKRARLTSVIGSLIFLNVPIVYMSVKWWRTLHQVQSSPETMDPSMVLALRLNALAMLAIAIFFFTIRLAIAKKKSLSEENASTPPPIESFGGSVK